MSRNKKPFGTLATLVLLWFLWPWLLPMLAFLKIAFLALAAYIIYSIVQYNVKANDKKKQEPKVQQTAKPQQQPIEIRKPQVDPEVEKLMKERNITISELRRLDYNIKDEKISAQIRDIENTSGKIFDIVIAHPDKLPQISKFLNYYLPTTLKLLNTYDRMGSQGVEGDNISGTMTKVEDTLDMVVTAFHKQLDTLFAGEALDVSADIAVMENLMKTEGLTEDEIGQIKLTLSQQ